MENVPRLYATLLALLQAVPTWTDVRHLHTLAWMVVGVINSGTVNLDAWSPYGVSRAVQAASTVRRCRRWLANPAVPVQPLYAPVIQQALAAWGTAPVYLALDTSLLWNQFCVVRVALLYRGRAIPLVWQVLAHPSSSVAYATYAPVLDASVPLLPGGCKVVFLADRGFADTALMPHCTRLGWHWRIRIKCNFRVYRQGREYAVRQVALQRGQACFLDHVHLTSAYYGPVYLALAYPQGEEPWYVVSDAPADATTLAEYGYRFEVEENFLDDKSNGFHWEDSRLRDAASLTRLGLVLAVTTLYLVAQGVAVATRQQRRWVAAHWHRGASYLKIGWNWVRKALVRGWTLLTHLHLPGGADPEPAQASQHQAAARVRPPFTVIMSDA